MDAAVAPALAQPNLEAKGGSEGRATTSVMTQSGDNCEPAAQVSSGLDSVLAARTVMASSTTGQGNGSSVIHDVDARDSATNGPAGEGAVCGMSTTTCSRHAVKDTAASYVRGTRNFAITRNSAAIERARAAKYCKSARLSRKAQYEKPTPS